MEQNNRQSTNQRWFMKNLKKFRKDERKITENYMAFKKPASRTRDITASLSETYAHEHVLLVFAFTLSGSAANRCFLLSFSFSLCSLVEKWKGSGQVTRRNQAESFSASGLSRPTLSLLSFYRAIVFIRCRASPHRSRDCVLF